MDTKLIKKIERWLGKESQERDLKEGALYYLRISRNRILYNNVVRAVDRGYPQKYAALVEYNLRKAVKFLAADVTHQQVTEMEREAKRIAEEISRQRPGSETAGHGGSGGSETAGHGGDKPAAKPQGTGARKDARRGGKRTKSMKQLKEEAKTVGAGMREDHDTLPIEIQALYTENLALMQKMRNLHKELEIMTRKEGQSEVCYDSDRYPFLKELIETDKLYHENWEKYDNYKAQQR